MLSILKNCGNSSHHSTNKAAGKLILAPETFKGLGRQDITLVADHGTGTLSTAEQLHSHVQKCRSCEVGIQSFNQDKSILSPVSLPYFA